MRGGAKVHPIDILPATLKSRTIRTLLAEDASGLNDFSFFDIFTLDSGFEAFQVEMPRLLCQCLDGAEMTGFGRL